MRCRCTESVRPQFSPFNLSPVKLASAARRNMTSGALNAVSSHAAARRTWTWPNAKWKPVADGAADVALPHTQNRWTCDKTCNEWESQKGKHKNRHVNRSVFFHSFTFNFYLFSCVRARDFYFLHNGPVCTCLHRSKQQRFVSATTRQKKTVGFSH